MGATKTYRRFVITQETYDLIMTRCMQEFLESNEAFKEIKMSQDFLLKTIARYYLEK